MAKKTFRITDMHCSACVMRLESMEDDLPGIKSARASYQKQILMVEYDERLLVDVQIVAWITHLGYTPEALPG